MTKILIFAEGISLAHPSRVSEMCRQLQGSDFELHIATPAHFHWIFKDIINVRIYDHPTISTVTFNQRLFNVKFPYTLAELHHFEHADEEIINQIRPQVIISDFRLMAFVAAKKLGIPFINLIQFYWNPTFKREPLLPHIKSVTLFGRKLSQWLAPIVAPLILKQQTKLINQFLEKYKIREVESIYDFYCAGDHLIYPDMSSFFDNPSLSEHEHFVGPLLWKNSDTPWPSHWPETAVNQKTIYLTMGSTGDHQIVPALIKHLDPERYRLFVSTSGHTYPGLENRPNVYFSDFVPAEKVIQMADIIVCNGGTSTTYQSISLGVPVFAFPLNMDQYLNCHQLKIKELADYDHIDTVDFSTIPARLDALIAMSKVKTSRISFKNEMRELHDKKPLETILKKMAI